MLDLKLIRENPEKFKSDLARKSIPPEKIDELLRADRKFRDLTKKTEELRAEQNQVSKKIPTLAGEQKKKLLEKMQEVATEKKKSSADLAVAEKIVKNLLFELPNPPHPDAPDGESDEENVVISEWGKKPKFDFEPREHFEIGEICQILDTERSAKVSGTRFYYLRNELAILQQSLVFWAFSEVAKKGFSPTIPPFLTKSDAIVGTGFFDKNENYCVNPGDDDLFLIGTSEVPMTSFFADEILDEEDLPQKFVAYSPCFRREAGSYGKDTRGIFRVHQFEKVEMVIFCRPEESERMHEEIREIEEDLLQKLEIPYRVVNVCTGDLGSSAAKKYDLEAWLPGQGRYREMTSTSICSDFQSRRLKIRLRRKNGKIEFMHTLNGTAVSSRPLVAILENFQEADGSVQIPKVLQKFCGFDRISTQKKSKI